MPAWLNAATGIAPRNGTSSHTITIGGTAGASATGFTPAVGNLLVFIMGGAVTHVWPGGWTEQLQPVNGSELSVATKTATSGDTSVSVTHNASNYPVQWAAFEFPAGTTYQTGVGQAGSAPNTWSALTGLTGTNLTLFAAVGQANTTAALAMSIAFGAPWIEYLDSVTGPAGGTDGCFLGIAYRDAYASTSVTASSTMTNPDGQQLEKVTFALSVPTSGATFTGSAALSGAGTLTGAGTPAISRSTALSGTGTLASTGKPAVAGSVTLSGSGALTASGSAGSNFTGAVALSGAGTLTTTAKLGTSGTRAFTGSGGLTASGTASFVSGFNGSASLSGSGSLAATGVPKATGAVALTGAGNLTLSAAVAVVGSIALGGSGELALSGVNLAAVPQVAAGNVANGFPVFDTTATPPTGGGQRVTTFEPPVVREAVSNGYPFRIKSTRGISLLKEGGSYRQVRIPTDDEVQAADVAYIGGYVYPIDSAEKQALTDAGYGERITTTGGGGLLTGVDAQGFPYVDTEGAASDQEASLTIVDGFPVFTTS